MRVEAARYVYRAQDRRRQATSGETRGRTERRRNVGQDRRARHDAHPWLTAAFGAHLLGQVLPRALPFPRDLVRTYRQPESRTPLRPRTIRTA